MRSKLMNKLFNGPKIGYVGEQKLFHRVQVYGPMCPCNKVNLYLKHNGVHQLLLEISNISTKSKSYMTING